MTLFQNNVQKYRTNGQEQVLNLHKSFIQGNIKIQTNIS